MRFSQVMNEMIIEWLQALHDFSSIQHPYKQQRACAAFGAPQQQIVMHKFHTFHEEISIMGLLTKQEQPYKEWYFVALPKNTKLLVHNI